MLKEWNLNRDWRFRLGDEPETVSISHAQAYQYSHAGSIWGTGSINYDDSDWQKVDLPHDYMSYAPIEPEALRSQGYRRAENAWYRKRFYLPKAYIGKHLLLVFGGIAMRAKVYLNGSLVAHSHSAYPPVEIDISDRAYFGDRVNTLAVEVDGRSLEGWFYEGSGIYRNVMLYAKERLHLAHKGVFLKPVFDRENWHLECTAEVHNTAFSEDEAQKDCYVTVKVYDGEQLFASMQSEHKTVAPEEEAVFAGSITLQDPILWEPDLPKLYRAKVILYCGEKMLDEQEHEIGFRTFEADSKRGFLLNGKPFKMKGTCNHQDHAGVGIAIPDAVYEYRLSRLQEMGSNTYRCAHSMPSDTVLKLCDRMGMVVIDENRHFEADKETLSQLEAMVRAARNHPCVVMYSLFNEEALQATREGQNIYRRLKSRVRKLDDSRLITAAMGGGTLDPNGTALLMDVTGINYSLDMAKEFHKRYPHQPVFGSENASTFSVRGCYVSDSAAHCCASYDKEGAEWGQSFAQTWKFANENEWYGGICLWTGFDYRGEPTPFDYPSVGSQFGTLDSCGFAKEGFYQNQAYFTDTPMIRLLPHWNHEEGETVRVMVHTNCDSAEVFLNGVSCGIRQSDGYTPCEWQIAYAPGELKAVGYIGQNAVACDVRHTAKKGVRLFAKAHKQTVANDGLDAVCINVYAVDENGYPAETANDTVYFEMLGDAVLLGVGNGDPNSHESDHESKRRLFAGSAQAIISVLPGAKQAGIRIYGEDLEPVTLELEVKEVQQPDYLASEDNRAVHGVKVSVYAFDKRPDVNMHFSPYDMNSLENIVFDTYSIKPVFTDGWKLFEIPFSVAKFPAGSGKCRFTVLELIARYAVLSVNGKVLYDAPHHGGSFTAEFDCESGCEYVLRLLIRGTGSASGIRGGVDISAIPAE